MMKIFGVVFIVLLVLLFWAAIRTQRKIKPRPFSDQIGANLHGDGSGNDIGKG